MEDPKFFHSIHNVWFKNCYYRFLFFGGEPSGYIKDSAWYRNSVGDQRAGHPLGKKILERFSCSSVYEITYFYQYIHIIQQCISHVPGRAIEVKKERCKLHEVLHVN